MRRIDGVALLYGAAGLIALVAVSGIQWSDMGEPLAWTTAQRNWDRKASLPWTWVRDGLSATLHLNHAQRALDLVTIGAVVVTIVYAWMSRFKPWPLEARLLPIALIIVPICTPTPESGMNRYVFAVWPSFIIGSEMLGRSPRWTRGVAYGVLATGSVVFARHWAHGKFLG